MYTNYFNFSHNCTVFQYIHEVQLEQQDGFSLLLSYYVIVLDNPIVPITQFLTYAFAHYSI